MGAVLDHHSVLAAMAEGSGPPDADVNHGHAKKLACPRTTKAPPLESNEASTRSTALAPFASTVDLQLVEMAGIEPASNGAESGLLRVQFASLFSAPEITRTSLRRAQSLFGFPLHPVTGIKV